MGSGDKAVMNTFRCKDLRKSFGGIDALDGVTLEFPNTGTTAIIGPNGAGKTTLLNVMTGFSRPDAGECFFGDTKITRMAAYRIARLGIARTFQDLRLVQLVSVLDNVLTARPNQCGESLVPAITRIGIAKEESENRAKSVELLEFVGLEDKEIHPAGELSYGQQKLLTLAVCLATEARVLFLDEPVAGVAPQMVDKIVSLLRQLQEQDKTIIFIEHDIETVRRLADHVIVMDNGKIVAQGPPGDVMEKPEIMEAYLG
jgi:ABC-type branched-subunit amino acid transport system ATPase component